VNALISPVGFTRRLAACKVVRLIRVGALKVPAEADTVNIYTPGWPRLLRFHVAAYFPPICGPRPLAHWTLGRGRAAPMQPGLECIHAPPCYARGKARPNLVYDRNHS